MNIIFRTCAEMKWCWSSAICISIVYISNIDQLLHAIQISSLTGLEETPHSVLASWWTLGRTPRHWCPTETRRRWMIRLSTACDSITDTATSIWRVIGKMEGIGHVGSTGWAVATDWTRGRRAWATGSFQAATARTILHRKRSHRFQLLTLLVNTPSDLEIKYWHCARLMHFTTSSTLKHCVESILNALK